MDQINNKPESELPWKYMPYDPGVYGPELRYRDELFIIHACNAYPKLIEMLWLYKDALEGEWSYYGIEKNRATALLSELGEL